jgi:Flp pilus assembly protein TadD
MHGFNWARYNNFMEAIDACDNTLVLDGNDPNILTDQGIMYRRIGWFDNAIENFTEANQVDPTPITLEYGDRLSA